MMQQTSVLDFMLSPAVEPSYSWQCQMFPRGNEPQQWKASTFFLYAARVPAGTDCSGVVAVSRERQRRPADG